MDHARPSLEGRIGRRKRSAKHFAEHLLTFLQYWQNAVELPELAESIDITSMQENDGRALTFVMIGDPNSVE
jgi:hypothetical protein